MSALLQVAVAVIRDAQGRVLIARRPPNVHQGSLWEFPGGKLEAGEDVESALRRELWEELHIVPERMRPLIRIPYHYSDRSVFLDVWQVDAFRGTPTGREGQPIRWVEPGELDRFSFPAANHPIVNAARLPPFYLITPDCQPGQQQEFLQRLERALARGIRLLQLRVISLDADAYVDLASRVVETAHAAGAQVLLNDRMDAVAASGADGVHLPSGRLRAFQRPKGLALLAASCHDAEELAAAVRLGVDFAVLSPVNPTPTHPHAQPMGWRRFAELVRDLPLPVYALGGVGREDLPAAIEARAQGVAGIRAFWG